MPRTADPDFVVDLDRGKGGPGAKTAVLLSPEEALERSETRAGLRDLDAMTEGMPGLRRQQRDRERIMPRAATAELGHPRMQRQLPGADEVRQPFSSRQKKARSKTRLQVQGDLPDTQYEAQARLTASRARWDQINEQLSATTGDLQAMPEAQQRFVRQVDRSIQAYEQANDRGHVVYSNVVMPPPINHTSLQAFLTSNFQPGDRFSLDRFTVSTHQLHETTRNMAGDPDLRAGRVAVLEIQTRRGTYLGQSDTKDLTTHLLPRGMQLEITGVHKASYRTPEGTTGTRIVIQTRDITPEPSTASAGTPKRPGADA